MTEGAFVAVYEMDFSREDFAEGLFEVVEVSTAKYDCSILVECIALKAVFQVFIYFRVLESSGFGKADQFWKRSQIYFVLFVNPFQKAV